MDGQMDTKKDEYEKKRETDKLTDKLNNEQFDTYYQLGTSKVQETLHGP